MCTVRESPDYAKDLASNHPLRTWPTAVQDECHVAELLEAVSDALVGVDLGEDSERQDGDCDLFWRWWPRMWIVRYCWPKRSGLGCAQRIRMSLSLHDRLRGHAQHHWILPSTRVNYDVIKPALNPWENWVFTQYTSQPLLQCGSSHRSRISYCLSQEDVGGLLAKGIIRQVSAIPKISLGLFKIQKKNGCARLLVDGRGFDLRSAPVLPPITPMLGDLEDFVRRHRWFTTLDFLGYFYQLEVSEALGSKLGIRTQHGNFVFRVAVPGTSRAPTIAQMTTCALPRLANVASRSLAIYDDVAIGGDTLREVRDLRARFLGVLDAANVVCRDDKGLMPTTGGVFDGVLLNLSEKTLGLDPEWVSKLAANPAQKTLTCRAAAHHLGCIRWACHVMRAPMAVFPLLARLSRHIGVHCGKLADWDMSLRLTDPIIVEFRAAETWLATCAPRRVQQDGMCGPTRATRVERWRCWTLSPEQWCSVSLGGGPRFCACVRRRFRSADEN